MGLQALLVAGCDVPLSRGAEGMWVLVLTGRLINRELVSYLLNDITFYRALFITILQGYASFLIEK